MATLVEWLFELFVVKLYEGLKALGMPPWLAVTTLVVAFGSVLGYGIYTALVT
jgi:hypothetical protein